MKKFMYVLVSVAVVVAGLGFWSARASTRNVTVTWQSDPARHVDPNFLQVTATSGTGTDYGIGITVTDSMAKVIDAFDVGNDPTTPFDGAADPVTTKKALTGYPTGAVFTVAVAFKDASGNVNATITQPWSKP